MISLLAVGLPRGAPEGPDPAVTMIWLPSVMHCENVEAARSAVRALCEGSKDGRFPALGAFLDVYHQHLRRLPAPLAVPPTPFEPVQDSAIRFEGLREVLRMARQRAAQ